MTQVLTSKAAAIVARSLLSDVAGQVRMEPGKVCGDTAKLVAWCDCQVKHRGDIRNLCSIGPWSILPMFEAILSQCSTQVFQSWA